MQRKKKRSPRFFIALYIGKIIQMIIKLIFKDRGTHFPGKYAIKICPDFLSRIGHPEIVIAVTGTNGKTSVSNFINNILIKNGYQTINNDKGSNISPGIASSLIETANLIGNVKADIAILEVDERASGFIYDHISPTYLVCTNLFRDSIKRNGHSEFILTKIKSSVPNTTTLILNADDLISCQIGNENHQKIYFGVNKLDITDNYDNIVQDIMVCPVCKHRLEFKYRHYHHIGQAYCKKCDFKSPIPNYLGLKVNFKKNILTIRDGKRNYNYKLISDSVFNIYNMVTVIATLRTLGLTHSQIKEGFNELKLKKDRLDKIIYQNLEVITMLSKDQNPVSCSRMFDYVASQPGNKIVVLLVTDSLDKVHGSEDISWLYDTDFEYLKDPEIKQIIVGGARSYDVLLRLQLAGIDKNMIKISTNYEEIEDMLNLTAIDKVYILYELYAYPLAFKLKQKIKERVGD
ncbi:MAG: MurT ligase domain-containing protein [Bacilli bacterium]|nr:MurT ligase domain-containing protein [Bacilli bacterium]